MNNEQRELVVAALALLEKQVANVRQAVEHGAPTTKTREMVAELQRQTEMFSRAIDLHIGAEAVLERTEMRSRPTTPAPRAKTLSQSRPGSTRGPA